MVVIAFALFIASILFLAILFGTGVAVIFMAIRAMYRGLRDAVLTMKGCF